MSSIYSNFDYLNLQNTDIVTIDYIAKDYVILSNEKTVTGSFVLAYDGWQHSVQVELDGDYQDFLSNVDNFKFLQNYQHKADYLIVGYGKQLVIPNYDISKFIANLGYKAEWMITKSAIVTYNYLVEDRRNCIGIFL